MLHRSLNKKIYTKWWLFCFLIEVEGNTYLSGINGEPLPHEWVRRPRVQYIFPKACHLLISVSRVVNGHNRTLHLTTRLPLWPLSLHSRHCAIFATIVRSVLNFNLKTIMYLAKIWTHEKRNGVRTRSSDSLKFPREISIAGGMKYVSRLTSSF